VDAGAVRVRGTVEADRHAEAMRLVVDSVPADVRVIDETVSR
jgi:hypothetical protein